MLHMILLLLYCTNKYFYFTAEVQERSSSIILYIIICNMSNICVMTSFFKLDLHHLRHFAMMLHYMTNYPSCLHETNTVLLNIFFCSVIIIV